jgi:hypothetical protein
VDNISKTWWMTNWCCVATALLNITQITRIKYRIRR